MLTSLHIKNYALIDKLEVDFTSGFSVITGETGTGKSVLLGAISMLLGERSETRLIREGTEKCIIEGHFDISSLSLEKFFENNNIEYDSKDCIIRRELPITGRSRFFINDTPVPAILLKELGNKLIDIHSQHKNLLLTDKNYQLHVLDILSENENLLLKYQTLFRSYNENRKELLRIKEEATSIRNDEEWLNFQLNEIDSADFHKGEQEELETESTQLTYAEEIQSTMYNAITVIDNEEKSLLQSLREVSASLNKISKHYPAANALSERIESNYIELKDCCDELRHNISNTTFAPGRIEYVNNRLALMYELFKKHHANNIDELHLIASGFRQRLEQITNSDDKIKELENTCLQQKEQLQFLCNKMTNNRKKAAQKFQDKISSILITLGMPMIRFETSFVATDDFTINGTDSVTFLFSANSISPLQPLADVASGGEMARVMLALKSIIAGFTDMPTLIFDEIDTGISGVIAERMGKLMQQMGEMNRQVISITHLPQVAALGSKHYKVYKEESNSGTHTNIIELSTEERVKEIAQMISGELLTESAIDTARNLIQHNK